VAGIALLYPFPKKLWTFRWCHRANQVLGEGKWAVRIEQEAAMFRLGWDFPCKGLPHDGELGTGSGTPSQFCQ